MSLFFIRLRTLPAFLALSVAAFLFLTLAAVSAVPGVQIASAQSPCTHYASPTGGGNGLGQTSPSTVASFWSVASPGKVLCLLDGVYTGASGMIDPPDGMSGSIGNPITVRALTDGKVLIDGQNARTPIRLTGNSWWVIEGVNAAHSNNMVVSIGGGSTQTTDNVVRRVIAWDANPNSNSHTISTWNAQRTLFEDIAAFGIGRYNIVDFQSTGTIVRRAWTRWERNNNIGGPQASVLMNYHTINNIFENIISTWDTQPGLVPNNTYAIIMALGSNNQEYYNGKLLGSIAYLQGGERFDANTLVLGNASNGITFKDVLAFVGTGFSNKVPLGLFGINGGGAKDLVGTGLTGVGGTGKINSDSQWKLSNTESGATINNVSSAFTGSVGATLCHRYVNGVLTSTPLWPWPMDQRIYDALRAAGKTPVNITAEIERMFGSIPIECKNSGDSPPPILVGDINKDGLVNSLDWSTLNARWGTSDAAADLNDDGTVNSLDFSILNQNWGRTS